MIEKYLEATNLKKDATWKDIRTLVNDAEAKGCYGVCSYLMWANEMKKRVKNCKVICVLGFPQGGLVQIMKDLEMVNPAVDEYDIVVPLYEIKRKKYKTFLGFMQKARKVTQGKILKAIIETAALEEKEFKPVIKICEKAGVDIIKTNTGLYTRLRPLEKDIELIKQFTNLPIKASGGISTFAQAKKLIDMGVARIGTSKPTEIIREESALKVVENRS